MAWAASTSFETTDGSTTPTDGNSIEGTGDGTGWSGNWTNSSTTGYIEYDTDVAGIPDGSWALMQDTSSENKEPSNYRALTTAVTSGRVSFRVRFNRDDRDNPWIDLREGGTRRNYILFGQQTTGTNRDLNVNGTVITQNNLAKDTWYEIEVDFDCTTDTLDIYVDGVKQNSSAINFESAATEIDQLGIRNNAASGYSATLGNIMWIDQIEEGSTGTAHTQDITETLTLVEGITLDPAKAIEEVATLVESVTRTTTTAFADALTLVDDLATQIVYDQQVSEAVTLIETLGDFVVGKQVTETVTAVETVARSLGRSIVDALTLVETVEAQTADYLQSVDETVTMVDTNTNVYTAGRATEDSVTVNEHLYGLLNGINMFWQDTYEDVTDTWSDIYLDY